MSIINGIDLVHYFTTLLFILVYAHSCPVHSQQLKPTMRRWFNARVVADAGYRNFLAGVYGYGLHCAS